MKFLKVFLTTFLILTVSGFVNAATIKGIVTDQESGMPLPGSNVTIQGTSMGSATDIEGRFVIPKVPPGMYAITVTYIGYEQAEFPVRISQLKQTIFQNAELTMAALEGEVVTVSAQAHGQLAAINQQLAADAMMNVVDGARIQELPDQNAAESIARLPGITVSRNNGEGSGIGIRGLAPQYNLIQIDGVTMNSSPEMGAATSFDNYQNRSVSLSNISQENLAGIEVYKAITPDMDAATLGGTVNIRLGKAPSESKYEARVFGSYNAMREDAEQYKVLGKMSRRFFNEKLGVQLSLNAEKRNRGSDRLSGWIQREDPYVDGERTTQFRTSGATIRHIRAIRDKQSINAIFDYATPGTELLFSNFYNLGSLTSREIQRSEGILIGRKTESESYTLSNALRGTHDLPNFEVEWQLSHYRSETETPDDYRHRWSGKDQTSDELNAADKLEITPEEFLELLPDDGYWSFFRTYSDKARIGETKYAGKLDIKYPFYYNQVSGFLKMGAAVRSTYRESMFKDRDLHNGRLPGNIPVNYSDYATSYNGDPVLNDHVSIRHYFDVDKIKPIWTDVIKDANNAKYQPLKSNANQDYDIRENTYAGYFMMKLNAFNELLTFIPGVRYEGEEFDANGYYAYLTNSSETLFNGVYEKQNAKRSNGFWLPMVHLKVKPVDWFDTRLAVTKTISRPNYRYRIPYVTVRYLAGEETHVGRPDIKTTESWNYDVSTSFYSSKFGLFTISGFYKEIKNLSFMIDYYIENEGDALAHGLNVADTAGVSGHYYYKDLKTPENTHGISTVKGIELDYQANLRALPGLLKYVTFGINYTRAWSKAYLRKYNVNLIGQEVVPYPPYIIEIKEYDIGFRRGPLLQQPDHILNVAVGYDIGSFSGKISSFFQGRSLAGMGKKAESDTYVEDYLRYDVSLRYRVNEKLSFLLTGVNITSTPDITSLDGTSKHSSYSVYGAVYDFGVQFVF